jgi:hypothetical protein
MSDDEYDAMDRLRHLVRERQIAVDGAVVTVGGTYRWLWEPPIADAYIRAARAVLDAGYGASASPFGGTGFNQVAMPCAFMQRHALELAIKDYLSVAVRRGEKLGTSPFDRKEFNVHKLEKLIKRANERM